MSATDQPRPAQAPARLRRDPASFDAPLAEARAACLAVLDRPTTQVAGAEARLRTALDDRNALKALNQAVDRHLGDASFHTLPPVRIHGRRIPGFHHLTCGRFRAIFLVGRDPTDVVALLFSRAPHDHMLDRLGELLMRPAPPPAAKQEDAP